MVYMGNSSIIPPITVPAWMSMMTSKDPGNRMLWLEIEKIIPILAYHFPIYDNKRGYYMGHSFKGRQNLF